MVNGEMDKRKIAALVLCGLGGLAGSYLYLKKRTLTSAFTNALFNSFISKVHSIKNLLFIRGKIDGITDIFGTIRRIKSRVFVVRTPEEWEVAFQMLKVDLCHFNAVGLDCEWVTREKIAQPVALLQIASQSGTCVLIRLCRFQNGTIPKSLREFLADSCVKKFGVAINEDAKKLYSSYGLTVSGCIDLRTVVLRLPKFRYLGSTGLKGLSQGILGKTLDKSRNKRCSDWEFPLLTNEQIEYAANDAFCAVDIFTELVLHRIIGAKARRGAEFDLEKEFSEHACALWQGIVDIKYSYKTSNPNGFCSETERERSPAKMKPSTKKLGAYSRAYSLRKRPLYHNCRLQAPDGQLLCTCDRKKAEWYIEKGLGEQIEEDPFTVRLHFEPAGRPESEENYYLQEKDNICVVCGASDSYIRKNIVPHEYRKHFPMLMKNHRSHDILLLCVNCHQKSGLHDGILRQQLASLCNAPIGSEEDVKFRQDPELTRVRSSAKALLRSREQLPPARCQELTEIVQNYYGVDELDDNILEKAVNMETKVPSEKFQAHGLKVVEHMFENDGLVQFEKMWRSNFLTTMQPKFLPIKWSVDHNHKELEGYESELQLRLGATSNGLQSSKA